MRARAEREHVFDEHESGDVVEAVLEHREPRVLLLLKERSQIADRRVVADRDDVGTRRHHLAHERIAEIDDALQQPALLALDQSFLLGRVDVGLGGEVRLLGGFVWCNRRRGRTLRRSDRSGNPACDGTEAFGNRRECRQQDFEDALGIAADDQQRQQQFAHEHEAGQRDQHERQLVRAVDADQLRDQRGRRAGDESEQQANRHEQQQRIVEVVAERARPVAPLGDEAQRQPHQRGERGFECAEIDRGAAEQKKEQRNHLRVSGRERR